MIPLPSLIMIHIVEIVSYYRGIEKFASADSSQIECLFEELLLSGTLHDPDDRPQQLPCHRPDRNEGDRLL